MDTRQHINAWRCTLGPQVGVVLHTTQLLLVMVACKDCTVLTVLQLTGGKEQRWKHSWNSNNCYQSVGSGCGLYRSKSSYWDNCAVSLVASLTLRPSHAAFVPLKHVFSFPCLVILHLSVAERLACPTEVWNNQGSNHTVGSCVCHDNCCDIQPWAQVAHLYCSA